MPQLNPQQQEAVTCIGVPVLVVAGAGSGKTNVIAYKIRHIIETGHCLPSQVAAITFTNKAAREMRARLQKIAPNNKLLSRVTIATFHTLGLQILRQESTHVGLKKKFSILDAHDTTMALQELTSLQRRQTINQIKNQISQWKSANVSPQKAQEDALSDEARQHALIYDRYQDILKNYQAVDFDDLILLPLQLFTENPERLTFWQNKIRYFLVDEYQDTNVAQYQLIKKLSYPMGNVTFVGDDDQAIYAWRGATIENIKSVQSDYPHLKIIRLEQNYRSTNTILQAANHLIQKNQKIFEKSLWSQLGTGKKITVLAYKNEELEAYETAQRILHHHRHTGSAWSQYAILYRNNYQSRLFEQHLRQNNIPYSVSGGQSFFELAEIKDVLAYLRLMVNNDDDIAFVRASTKPSKGIGPTTLGKLGQYAAQRQVSLFEALFETGFSQQMDDRNLEALTTFGHFINRMSLRAESEPADQIVTEILTSIGYEDYLMRQFNDKEASKKWTNIQFFVKLIARRQEQDGKNLPTITQNIALMSIISQKETEKDQCLELSTIHAAKGLEFGCVFIIGCNEGLLPHQDCIDNDLIEEERRLTYVAITRARQELVISYTESRRTGGEVVPGTPSRFIEEAHIDGPSQDTTPTKEEKNAYLERMRSAPKKKKPLLI